MNNQVPALQVSGLEKTFIGHLSIGKKKVLNSLSLNVPQGSIYGFLGPNGSGKTTTIKCIVGLIFADSGSIHVVGEEVPKVESRRHLAYLPEHPYFYDYLSGQEILAFMARLQGMPASKSKPLIPELLEKVGLTAAGKDPVRKYSKGMMQRLGLAKILMAEPALAILDEPMSGLDPQGRRLVRDLILELREKGTTVFFSSHILHDAESLCDRVAIISKGRVIQEGPLQELLRRDTATVEILLGETLAENHPLFSKGQPVGSQFLLRLAGESEAQRALAELVKDNINVLSMQSHRETLEDVFLESTGGKT